MKYCENPGCSIFIWSFWNYLLNFFCSKVTCFKNTASRKVSGRSRKGFRKGIRKVKTQYAKHCIPEGIRKVPEGYPEVEPEGKVQFSHMFSTKGIWFVLVGIRKENGRYPEATFTQKCDLRARVYLVTFGLPWHTCPHQERGASQILHFLIVFCMIPGRKKSEKHKSNENPASRKVSGRSRKGIRKWTRKGNFRKEVMWE